MKKIILVAALSMFLSNTVAAESLEKFSQKYKQSGLDTAVADSVQTGVATPVIVDNALKIKGIGNAELIKALYCAGDEEEDIVAAAEKYRIADVDFARGYKKSITECGAAVIGECGPCASKAMAAQNPERFRQENIAAFQKTYKNAGIDQAVAKAISNGMGISDIVQNGLRLENLSQAQLVKALACSCADGDDVRLIAQNNGVARGAIDAGFQQSLRDCQPVGKGVQAYTPVKSTQSAVPPSAVASSSSSAAVPAAATVAAATGAAVVTGSASSKNNVSQLTRDIQSVGACKAVSSAVAAGTPVSSIIAHGSGLDVAGQKSLLTALYTAGVNEETIRISAESAKVPDLLLVEAFNASKQGCVDDKTVARTSAPTATKPAVASGAQTAAPAAAATGAAGAVASSAPAATAPASTAGNQTVAGASGGGSAAPVAPAGAGSWTVDEGGKTLLLGEYWATFVDNYQKLGIDQTASLAIKDGILPDAFMQGGLAMQDLNPQNLIKAMYCAGYKGDDIKKASDQFKVSELVLIAGFKKSKEECSDQVTDSQAYTPAPSFTGVPAPGGGGQSYASPSTFQ